MDEEVAKQIHLDEMIAKRMIEEEALSKQQKKRKAQVQFEAQYYTEEDWDAIRAKLEANAELTKVTVKNLHVKLSEESRNLEAFSVKEVKLKRYREELQTKTLKKQKIDDKDVPAIGEKVAEVKEEELVKRTGKGKKQKARKGISVDKNAQGDSETDTEESVEAMNPTPLATKSNIMVGNAKVWTNRPEDAYDRVLWSDLRTMFDPPLNEYAIWSLPLQQKMVSWRYYDKCAVHCLTLEASTIYMLADRKYPLSKDACQVMLKMKLLDGTMDKVCYKLLKMIEKQAKIRK
ncbi:hypothetical protein Tco_0238030 [Tanacetum coccineum]